MTNNRKKSWKFNFVAVKTQADEYERWIDAETKEEAIKKLKENFNSCDYLNNINLMDVKEKEVA